MPTGYFSKNGLYLLCFCFLLSFAGGHDFSIRYDNHRLLRVYPSNQRHVKHLATLHASPSNQVKLWNEPGPGLSPVHLQVPTRDLYQVLKRFSGMGLRHEILKENIQRILDDHRSLNTKAQIYRGTRPYDFSDYLDWSQISAWLDDFVRRCPSQLHCKLINFGSSHENRTLLGVKISSGGAEKRSFWLDGGIHAREWISPAVILFVMKQIVEGYGRDEAVTRMLHTWDFFFLPVMNPDGYQYSWDADRLWRKTRSQDSDTGCYGTDLNRNFGFHWKSIGASNYPCSSTYAGSAPFSEPESLAVKAFIDKREGMFDVFLTTHSYGQLILLPYGYTRKLPRNYTKLLSAGRAIRDALYQIYGTVYRVDSASRILYKSSGTSRDWAFGAAHIPYVFTLELRDRGRWGFLLPPAQILPTAEETWVGMKAMSLHIIKNKNKKIQPSS